MGEVELAAILCAMLGGEVEKRHHFAVLDRVHYVSVDCETPTHVIEVGLDDRRSSYDSVHQAGFAASLTGKTPSSRSRPRRGAPSSSSRWCPSTSCCAGA
jgi:hypothetical protein